MYIKPISMSDSSPSLSSSSEPFIRLSAFWALSEAGLAGVLHIFRVPFTGLVMGNVAVLFIALIYSFEPRRGTILKATLLVMMLKALVSPHTPINAYFAVAFQGLSGELLFLVLKRTNLVVPVFAVLVMVEASLQKLAVLTVVFGQTLWESINIFTHFILSEFSIDSILANDLNYSMLFVAIYAGIHIVSGVLAGGWIPILIARIQQRVAHTQLTDLQPFLESERVRQTHRKKRWAKKLSLYLLFSLATIIFIGSYLFPFFEKSQGYAAFIMVLRSIAIMSIWYFLAAPAAMRILQKYFKKKKSAYHSEIQLILKMFPLLKSLVRFCWKESAANRGPKRMTHFIELALVYLLVVEMPEYFPSD